MNKLTDRQFVKMTERKTLDSSRRAAPYEYDGAVLLV